MRGSDKACGIGPSLWEGYAMTKKAQILALDKAGHTTRQIAEIVYGISPSAPYIEADRKMAYVRVALPQRGTRLVSEADKTYLLKRYKASTIKEAWKNRSRESLADPVKRARHNEVNAASKSRRRAREQLAEASP